MVGHGGSSAGSYLTNPTSPIPSHCASIVVASTFIVGLNIFIDIQTSKTLTQMDINKMMKMEFIQWRVNTYSQKAET